MKITAKPFLLISPLLGLFTFSCSDNLGSSKDAGAFCIYAGVRYTPGQNWKAKDGCNVCTCGFESQALCSQLACGVDGGKPGSETGPSPDLSPLSDALAGGDLGTDQIRDSGLADVSISGDAKVIDAAVDLVSDARLISERD